MVVYYRDRVVRVDSTAIEVADRRYPLERLGYVWYRRTRRFFGRRHLRTRMLLVAVLGGAALLAVIAALATIDFGNYTWHVLTGAVVVWIVLASLAGFGVDPVLDLLDRGHERGSGVHEMWARVDGVQVLLFTTGDALRFGKVYRAVQRALEQATPKIME